MFETKPLTKESVQVCIKAMRRLMELNSSAIVTRDTDTEKQTCIQLLQRMMVGHASEFLGTWQVMNNEYTPLVQGIAGVLKRAVALNEQEAFARAQAQAQQKAQATTPKQDEAAAASVTQGEASPAADDMPAGKRLVVHFGEADKSGAPVVPAEPNQDDAPSS